MRIEEDGPSLEASNGHAKKDSWMSHLRGLFSLARIDDRNGPNEAMELPSPNTMVRNTNSALLCLDSHC